MASSITFRQPAGGLPNHRPQGGAASHATTSLRPTQAHRARLLARRSFTALFLRAVCTYPRMLQLLLAYLGFVAIIGQLVGFGQPCPSLACDEGVRGFLWDHQTDDPSLVAGAGGNNEGGAGAHVGHLMVKNTGEGPNRPDSCSQLCKDVPECAFWMYKASSRLGWCKLWTSDQNPCEARVSPTTLLSLLSPLHWHWPWHWLSPSPSPPHFTHSWMNADYLVGGTCRAVKDRQRKKRSGWWGGGAGTRVDRELMMQARKREQEERQAEEDARLGRGECPKIKCNTMTRGFIYDHPHLGHLKEDKTGVGPNRPHTCYLMCRQTANCSFWMYDIKSKEGYCKMWTRLQSPCEPEDPFDSNTAHFVAKHPEKLYAFGGYCDKMPPYVPRPRHPHAHHRHDRTGSQADVHKMHQKQGSLVSR